MKMTKVVPFAMTALLLGSVAIAPTASASEGEAVVTNATQQEQQNPQVQPIFVKVAGTVENVEERNNATYYTTKDGENTNVFVVNKDTLIFDNTGKEAKLQKGDKVTAYTYANKPMLMIYPPQYNTDVIIVETEEMGSATVDFFDKDLVNTDNSLKLNVGKETKVESQSGKAVTAEDLAEQHLLVFYTITTRSIPAQTPPTKVIVLDADFGGIITDPWGNQRAGFEFAGELNRKDFGLSWSATTEAGGLVVADKIKLIINLEFVQA